MEPRGPLLSLLWPAARDIEGNVLPVGDDQGYRLRERGGWIASSAWATHRSKTCTMVGEGSFVNQELAGPVGGMADVTPAVPVDGRHRVYRYGYGLFLDEERL